MGMADWMPTTAMKRLISNVGSPNVSLGKYTADKGVDSGDLLYALQKNKGGVDPSSIENDPLYQLDLQAADAKYPGGGGGTSAKLAQSLANDAYGGPSMADLMKYGQQGQNTIQNLYSQLNSYLQNTANQTAGYYNQGGQAINSAYDEAAKNQAAAEATAQQNIAAQNIGGTAGAGAAADAQAAAKAALARQGAMLASNRAAAQTGQAKMAEGEKSIAADFMAGAQNEKTAQSGKWQNQVNNLVSKAQAEMAAAAQKQASDRAAIQNEASSKAGQNQAAKLNALKDAIKRAQSDQSKGDKLSGMEGVLQYAMRANRPDLAAKFMSMLGASRSNAATQNQAAKAYKLNPSLKPTSATTPEEQLQLLMQNAGGPSPQDLADQNLDPRGDIFKMAKSDPKLAFLKQYLISNPEQARKAGEYQSAFGMSQQDYEKKLKEPGQGPLGPKYQGPLHKFGINWNPADAISSLFGGGGGSGQVLPTQNNNFVNQMNQRFTPFLNLTALRRNPNAVKQYYDYFQGSNKDTDLLSTLYNIYGGKYGMGG